MKPTAIILIALTLCACQTFPAPEQARPVGAILAEMELTAAQIQVHAAALVAARETGDNRAALVAGLELIGQVARAVTLTEELRDRLYL